MQPSYGKHPYQLIEAAWHIHASVNLPSLSQIKASRLFGNKPLSEPTLDYRHFIKDIWAIYQKTRDTKTILFFEMWIARVLGLVNTLGPR